jgi:PEP-CTERM motif-containing protein
MRQFLLGCLIVVALSGAAKASFYDIDPSIGATTVGVSDFGSTCPVCTTATESPLYSFSAGDVVDLGTLVVSSTFDVNGSFVLRYDPLLDWAFGPLPAAQLGMDQFFTPSASCDQSVTSCTSFLNTAISRTFDLHFTLPSSGQFQMAWQGGVTSYVPAVPEPATWLMMLIGFAAVGFVARPSRVLQRTRALWFGVDRTSLLDGRVSIRWGHATAADRHHLR